MTKWVDVRLVYDTKAQPLPSGVRAVMQRARRLLYAADETELVLQIAPGKQAERFTLAGQMLEIGSPVEGARVKLHGPEGNVHETTDDEGEFQIGSLPRGRYSLEVESPERLIRALPLEVE
jgi:hypothetical protein